MPIVIVVVVVRTRRVLNHHVPVVLVAAMAMGLTCLDDRSLLPRRRSDSETEPSRARRAAAAKRTEHPLGW